MSNVERLRQAYQAWHDSRGKSSDVWLDLFADHFKLRSLGDGAQELEFSAPRDGKDAMRGYFASLERDWEMLFYHADEFVADGDRVVMIGRCGWKHRRTGKQNETPVVAYWRFQDGRAVEYFEFYDTAKSLAAAQMG
jgi:ketosteroid isomerase-like protein